MAATLAHLTFLWSTSGGGISQVGLDFESNNALTEENLDQMLAAARDGASSFLDDNYTTRQTFIAARAFGYDIDVNPTPPPPNRRVAQLGPRELTFSVPGVVNDDPCPPQVSVVYTFRTAAASRRGRGRIYTPAPPRDLVDAAGIFGPPSRANTEADWNSWIVGIQNAAVPPQTFTHVVVSLTEPAVRPVTVRAMRSRVDTQRRRLEREPSSPE